MGKNKNNPEDVPTRVVNRDRGKPAEQQNDPNAPTRKVRADVSVGAHRGYPPDASTRIVAGKQKVRPESGNTRLASPGMMSDAADGSDPMDDPVVGWLVVIDGPGSGAFVRLGYGTNSIGRDHNQRVCLDFGDERISREEHAIVTFDPKSQMFYAKHGGGVNLTYLGDKPILETTEIHSGAEINMGDTRLRFIALCGPDFMWQQ